MELSVNRIVLALVAAVLPVMICGQETVKPVTVCEVLSNPQNFGDKPVAIVGRLDCTFSIENSCYLVEDRCGQPFVSDGKTWPNKIWIEFVFPAAPKSNVEIGPSALSDCISAVRKSTSLGTHRVMLLKSKDGVLVPDRWSDQPDEWGVAYGRILIT